MLIQQQIMPKIEKLNHFLSASKKNFFCDRISPIFPTIFVIGPPRSGTTLVGQIIGSNKNFAKISNIAALFWEAPAIGALVDTILSSSISHSSNHFFSKRGKTNTWEDASEFGYFWNRWFGDGSKTHNLSLRELNKIDRTALRKEIGELEEIFGRPIVFKNNTWCSFQADWLKAVFPLSVFIVCRRSILYIAQSLLLARNDVHGDTNKWWSTKPSTYHKIKAIPCPFEQVVLQARDIEKEIREAIHLIPSSRLLIANYKDVCKNPNKILNDTIEKCNKLGANLTFENLNSNSLEHQDHQKLSDNEWEKLYQAYCKHGI